MKTKERLQSFISNQLASREGTIALSTVAIALSRFTTMLVPLITIPWSIKYLGTERFGMWMAATALIPLLSFFGGGIGSSVLNAVSRAYATGDNKKLRMLIGTAFTMIVPLAAIMLFIGLSAAYWVSWEQLIGLKTAMAKSEAADVVAVVFTTLSLGFVVNVGAKVRIGLQQMPAVAAWEILAAALVLPTLLLAINQGLSTPWLIATVILLPVLIKGAGFVIFMIGNRQLQPSFSDFDLNVARDLAAGSSLFLVTTLAHGFAVGSDHLLISNIIGAYAVADYSIVLRLFTIPLYIASTLYGAQWPVFAEAAARHDFAWIRSTFARTIALTTMFAVILSAVMLYFVKDILQLWVGDTVRPSNLMCGAVALYGVLVVVMQAFQNLMFSLDERRIQIRLSLLMASFNIVLTIYLLHVIGSAGAIIATNTAYIFCLIIPYIFLTRAKLTPESGATAPVGKP